MIKTKLITFLAVIISAISAYAVSLDWNAFRAAHTNGFDAVEAYIDSIDETPAGFSSVEQWSIATKINLYLGSVHFGLPAATVQQKQAQAAQLFNANKDSLKASDALQIALRMQKYDIAAQKLEACSNIIDAAHLINYAVACYKGEAISKDKCIEYILLASSKNISKNHLPFITKAIVSLPKRGLDGAPFMTVDQRKEFYGNFLSLVEVSKESREFLGICKTEYQLVK